MPSNNAKTWTLISVILTVVGSVMVAAGIIIDEYNFYWMIFVGAVLAITFFICFFMFVGQAKRLDGLFKGRERLVFWRFDAQEHLVKAEKEFTERKYRHRMLLAVVTFFFVVITALFLIFGFDDPDEALFFLGLMGGVLALIYAVALLTPRSAFRKMKRSAPEVYVGPYSAWVMGQYTQWKAPMTQIRGVRLLREETGAVIEVNFRIYQRYVWQEHVCRIPAPAGREEEARYAAAEIARCNQTLYEEA